MANLWMCAGFSYSDFSKQFDDFQLFLLMKKWSDDPSLRNWFNGNGELILRNVFYSDCKPQHDVNTKELKTLKDILVTS